VGVVRTWVFPVLRLLLFAAIAVALLKVAFFPDTQTDQTPAVPTGSLVEPQIPVGLGTVVNTVTVDASVSADPAQPAKSTAAGTVDDVFAPKGTAVDEGDPILDVKTTTDTGGTVFVRVLAPVAGIVSNVKFIHNQAVQIGDVVAQVSPSTFSVSGALSADKQYRLLTVPAEATVTINGGPAPFTCGGVAIKTPSTDTNDDTTGNPGTGSNPGSGGGSGSGSTVSCAVPGDVRVFAGLSATIELAGGTAENVLVVPTTAVKGSAGTGKVWFVKEDGTNEERPVTLGLNDGQQVQIVDGVAEGDQILQFVPGAAPNVPEGCEASPDGSFYGAGQG
jgi:macrolide-specific efflux system membrane fusion protein